MSTPRTVEEITPEWLGAALAQRHPGVTVDALAVEDIMAGMATKVRVRPSYGPGSPEMPPTLIVKGHLGGHDLGNSFSFELEMQSYRLVVPTARIHAPACLFAGTGAGGPVLVLQDLKPLGARFLDPAHPLSRDQAVRYLQAMAALHAHWWNAPMLDEAVVAPWLSEAGEVRRQMDAYFIDNVGPVTWNAMAELPRGLAVPRDLRDQAKVSAALQRFLRFRSYGPRTISHGDEHLSNLYVLPDGTPGMLDWQSRKEPWSVSFAYFSVLTLDVLDRRAWERDLLAIYLAALNAAGGPRIAFADAWQAYRESIIFPYGVWFTNRPAWQPEPFVAACTARAAWAAYDLDIFSLGD